jgi:GT2 family glycosyltransferase
VTTAVLITCFNRKEKTQACLEQLFSQKLPQGMELMVFVCDDLSTDGTGQLLKEKFPQVKVTTGNGKLYWGGGMRAAWKLAKSLGKYDFYMWLNDDTLLSPNALTRLFADYHNIGKPAIVVGACRQPNTDLFGFGGHDAQFLPIPPVGTPQEVTYTNGNLLLIPALMEAELGMISPAYTHYLGDYDYSLRALEAGFSCYTSSEYLAECTVDKELYWADPNLPFLKRWQLAHAVKGLALNEYIHFKSYHQGRWIGFKSRIEVYLKVLFPTQYVHYRNLLLGRKTPPPPENEGHPYGGSSTINP